MGQYQYRDWVVMVVARPGPPEELASASAHEPIPRLRESVRVGRAEAFASAERGGIRGF